MTGVIEDTRTRMQALETELRELAARENRSDEDNARLVELDAEHQRLSGELRNEEQRVADAREAEKRQARVEASRAKWASLQVGQTVEPYDTADIRSLSPMAVRDRARKHIDDTTHNELYHVDDKQREALHKLIKRQDRNVNGAHIAQRLLLTEHPHYRSAFMRVVTSPVPVLTAEESQAYRRFEEWRSMSIGTDSEGGFGVPVLIDPTIMLSDQGTPNVILDMARVETITTDTWKGVSSAGMVWRWGTEASETTDGSPTLAQPTVPVHKADGFIPYSIEVGMDYPGFAGEMTTLLREGYSEHLIQAFTVGTGSDQPTGIITAIAGTAFDLTVNTAGAFVAGDVYDTWAALPVRFRQPESTAWMSDTEVQNAIRQFGAEGGSDFSINLTQEAIPRMFGRRYPTNDYMAGLTTSTTATTSLLIVGDWRQYLVAMRAGMNVELVPHVFGTTSNFPTGERAWYAWARVGADSVIDNAFRLLRNAT